MSSQCEVVREPVRAGIMLLRVRGQLDIAGSPHFKETLFATIDDGAVGLVVDLVDVTFVDSSGFTALIAAVKRLALRDGRVSLVSTDPSVARLLRMMRLTDVLPTFATREEAIASLDGLEAS